MNRTAVTTPGRLGPRSAGISLTPQEFDRLPPERFDDRYRYELIRGVLVVTPPPGNTEIDPNEELGYLLRSHQEQHPQGSVIDKTLSEQTIATFENRRRCDRAIWTGLGRIPDPEKDVPSIVVEFVSGSRRDFRRDYEEKRAEYLAIGVREYWIIDRFRRIMTAYRNRSGVVDSVVVGESDTYQTELLPGFILPLARLLAKADDWRSDRRRSTSGGTD